MELSHEAMRLGAKIRAIEIHSRAPNRHAWPNGPRWLTQTVRYRKLKSRLNAEIKRCMPVRASRVGYGYVVRIRKPSHNGLLGAICRLPADKLAMTGRVPVKVITPGANNGDILQLGATEYRVLESRKGRKARN